MAIEIKSNSEYKGDAANLPGANAPMPDNASLYLDFENGLYIARNLTTGAVFRSTIISEIMNFSRASQKTCTGPYGVIQTAGNNEPVIEYDCATKRRLGVSIHNASANKVKYSEDFLQPTWGTAGLTMTAQAGASPDGTRSATMLTEGVDNSAHTLEETGATATPLNNYHTFSIYVKPGTARFVQLYAAPEISGNTYANFDLGVGTVVKTTSAVQQAGIEPAPGGYWRISITTHVYAAYNTGGAGLAFINDALNAGLKPAYTGTGKTLYVWGAQLEVREAATPYMQTAGAGGSRSAETLNANNAVTGYMSADAGTIYVEALMPDVNQSPLGVLAIGNGFFGVESTTSTDDYIAFYQKNLANNAGIVAASAYKSGVNTTLNTQKGSAPAGREYRGMLAYDAGQLITYDDFGMTSAVVDVAASAFGRICIGRGRSPANNQDALYFSGIIQKIVYYPVKLTETQLSDLYDAGL